MSIREKERKAFTPIWINATVEDNYVISKVQIYINGTLVHEEDPNNQSASVSYLWDPPSNTSGTYVIEVVAYDAADNENSSLSVNYVNPLPIPENWVCP